MIFFFSPLTCLKLDPLKFADTCNASPAPAPFKRWRYELCEVKIMGSLCQVTAGQTTQNLSDKRSRFQIQSASPPLQLRKL